MADFKLIEFYKTRNFGDKMNATFEFLRQNIKPLFKSLLYIGGIPLVIGSFLFARSYNELMKMGVMADPGTDPSLSLMMEFGISMGISALILLVSIGLIISSIKSYLIIYEEKQSNQIDVPEVWAKTKTLFWRVLGAFLLYTITILGVYFMLILITIGISAITFGVGFILIFGVIVLIVYLAVVMSMIYPIIAFENKNFFSAFPRAFFLIKGKWWSTFGLLFILALIQSIIASIFMVPWYIIFIIQMLHTIPDSGISEPSMAMEIVGSIFLTLYFLVSYLMYSIPLTGLSFQYFNLVELKESKGLMQQIGTIGEEPQSKDDEEDF